MALTTYYGLNRQGQGLSGQWRRNPYALPDLSYRPAMPTAGDQFTTEDPERKATDPVAEHLDAMDYADLDLLQPTSGEGEVREGPELQAPQNAAEQHVMDDITTDLMGLAGTGLARGAVNTGLALGFDVPPGVALEFGAHSAVPSPVAAGLAIGKIGTKGVAKHRLSQAYEGAPLASTEDYEGYKERTQGYAPDLDLEQSWSPEEMASLVNTDQYINTYENLTRNPFAPFYEDIPKPAKPITVDAAIGGDGGDDPAAGNPGIQGTDMAIEDPLGVGHFGSYETGLVTVGSHSATKPKRTARPKKAKQYKPHPWTDKEARGLDPGQTFSDPTSFGDPTSRIDDKSSVRGIKGMFSGRGAGGHFADMMGPRGKDSDDDGTLGGSSPGDVGPLHDGGMVTDRDRIPNEEVKSTLLEGEYVLTPQMVESLRQSGRLDDLERWRKRSNTMGLRGYLN